MGSAASLWWGTSAHVGVCNLAWRLRASTLPSTLSAVVWALPTCSIAKRSCGPRGPPSGLNAGTHLMGLGTPCTLIAMVRAPSLCGCASGPARRHCGGCSFRATVGLPNPIQSYPALPYHTLSYPIPGVAIALTHGTWISWDGRCAEHCTAVPKVAAGDRLLSLHASLPANVCRLFAREQECGGVIAARMTPGAHGGGAEELEPGTSKSAKCVPSEPRIRGSE